MALYEFAFAKPALDFLSTVDLKLRRQIIRKARALLVDPYPPGSKQLVGVTTQGGDAVRRVRSGDYRIMYVVKNGLPQVVLILDIKNRRDAYR
jgi:mRNA interferase RelE/StbE